jgi:phenylacetate-CoA ligase
VAERTQQASLLRRIAERIQSSSAVDYVLRHNPAYYHGVRRLASRVRSMDREARRRLTEDLTGQTLAWARLTRAGRQGPTGFASWPLVTKTQLRGHPEHYWRRGQFHIEAATSGSTGIPVRLRRSLRCVAAEQAFLDDMLDAQLAASGRPDGVQRFARLRSDPVKPIDDRSPPFGVRTHAGHRLVLSTSHLGPDTVRWFHDELSAFAPDVLFTTPGTAESFARFLHDQGLRLSVPVIMTSSETLYPNGRAFLQAQLGGFVVDYYGLAERVALAVSVGDGPYFFNPAYGRIELLPLGDADAPPGFRAYEIVATSFWNDAMPLVRFQTGDRVIVPDSYDATDLEDVTLGLKPVSKVEGRDRVNVLSPRGETLVGLPHLTKDVAGLLRLQVIQETPRTLRLLVLVDPQRGSIDEAALMRNVAAWIPCDMRVAVEQVEQFERLPSGKTPFVINRVHRPIASRSGSPASPPGPP